MKMLSFWKPTVAFMPIFSYTHTEANFRCVHKISILEIFAFLSYFVNNFHGVPAIEGRKRAINGLTLQLIAFS